MKKFYKKARAFGTQQIECQYNSLILNDFCKYCLESAPLVKSPLPHHPF